MCWLSLCIAFLSSNMGQWLKKQRNCWLSKWSLASRSSGVDLLGTCWEADPSIYSANSCYWSTVWDDTCFVAPYAGLSFVRLQVAKLVTNNQRGMTFLQYKFFVFGSFLVHTVTLVGPLFFLWWLDTRVFTVQLTVNPRSDVKCRW